jgi:type I restriction enzyme, S subunit
VKDHWQKKPLGDVCEIVNGGTPRTGIAEYWGGRHLWITPAEMGKRISPYVDDTERKISDSGLRESSARLLPRNSVILSSRAPIGHLVINTKPMSTNQGCKGLIPRKQLQHKFLYYYLTSIVDLLNSLGSGATFKELSGGKLREVPVPIAPYKEQERIVAILDEAFDSITTAKANADKNLQNANALFESYLQSVFSQAEKKWEKGNLGEIAEVQSGGTPSVSQKEYWSGGIPWYSSGELNETYTVDPERYISKAGLENSNAKLFPKGSLLIGMYDTAALKMSILDRGAAFNQAIAGVKPNERVEIEFVLHAINARKPSLLLERRGVRQKNLSLGKIKGIEIPLPRIAEQRALVAGIRGVVAETQRLESACRQKLTALEDLRNSLLHRAFSGRL